MQNHSGTLVPIAELNNRIPVAPLIKKYMKVLLSLMTVFRNKCNFKRLLFITNRKHPGTSKFGRGHQWRICFGETGFGFGKLSVC